MYMWKDYFVEVFILTLMVASTNHSDVKQKKEEVMNMNFNLDQVPYLAEVDRLLMRD